MSMFLFSESLSLLFWSMNCPTLGKSRSSSSGRRRSGYTIKTSERKYPLRRVGWANHMHLGSVRTSTTYSLQPRPPRWNFSRALAPSYGGCQGYGSHTRSLSSRLWIGSSSKLVRWSDWPNNCHRSLTTCSRYPHSFLNRTYTKKLYNCLLVLLHCLMKVNCFFFNENDTWQKITLEVRVCMF